MDYSSHIIRERTKDSIQFVKVRLKNDVSPSYLENTFEPIKKEMHVVTPMQNRANVRISCVDCSISYSIFQAQLHVKKADCFTFDFAPHFALTSYEG